MGWGDVARALSGVTVTVVLSIKELFIHLELHLIKKNNNNVFPLFAREIARMFLRFRTDEDYDGYDGVGMM